MPLVGSAAGAPDEWRQWTLAEARLAVARLARLEHDPADDPGVRQRQAWENAHLRGNLRALALNVPPPRRAGLRLEAYVCANDDSAQPFLRYLPPSWSPDRPAPLLVFLHGYDPSLDELSDPYIPAVCAAVADETGAAVLAPFGRANTDYQGIGEQDVLRAIDEMAGRYNIDRQRVVLFGWSMGGLGAWCVAARHPDRFNGVFVLSGRGDFYLWHGLKPADLPPWQRRLVDVQFASAWLPNVTNLTVLAAHGMRDDLIGFEQGRGIFERLQAHDPHGLFLAYPNEGHGVFDSVLLHPKTMPWLRDALLHAKPKGLRAGETGSRLQNAFLRPFVFIGADATDPKRASRTLAARAAEWHRFAKAEPRTMLETAIDTNVVSAIWSSEPSARMLRWPATASCSASRRPVRSCGRCCATAACAGAPTPSASPAARCRATATASGSPAAIRSTRSGSRSCSAACPGARITGRTITATTAFRT